MKTWRSLKFLIKGPIILVILFIINWVTFQGVWWIKWAAFGIGIAWIISFLRVLSAAVMLGGLAALVAYFRKK